VSGGKRERRRKKLAIAGQNWKSNSCPLVELKKHFAIQRKGSGGRQNRSFKAKMTDQKREGKRRTRKGIRFGHLKKALPQKKTMPRELRNAIPARTLQR